MKRKWPSTGILLGALFGGAVVWLSILNLDLSLSQLKLVLPGQATFEGIDISKRTSAYFTHLLIPFALTFIVTFWLYSIINFKAHWFKILVGAIFSAGLAVLSIGLLSEFKFNYDPISIVWLAILLLFFLVKPSRWRKPKAVKWKFRAITYVGVLLLPFPLILKLIFLVIAYVWASRQIRLGHVNAQFLAKNIYPTFIFLAGAVIYWNQPFIDQYELFENANPANAMMRVFKFGEIPFVDFISSHMLSEQVPMYLYALLKGYDGSTDALAWLNLFKPLALLIYFYFLKDILSSASWAFAIMLLFPFVELVIPLSYWLALVSVFIFFNYFKNPGWKTIAYSILWTIFLVFWRIDIAAAHIPAFAVLVVLHLFKNPSDGYMHSEDSRLADSPHLTSPTGEGLSAFPHGERRGNGANTRSLIIKWSLLSFIALAIGIAAVYLLNQFYDGRIAQNIDQALSYFGASQAHGYSKIAPDYASWMFIAHHFVFPCLVLLILASTVKSWNIRGKNLGNQFLRAAIIFLSLYYFFNASRGLVRHGFIEGSDRAISSFFFLIITLFALLKVSAKRRPWVFVIVSSLLILIAKYGGQSAAQSLITKLTPDDHAVCKMDMTDKALKNAVIIDSLTDYLDGELNKEETFFDFSNTPMLYFYTQRKVPSYFNQSLQNEVTEKIQRINLEQIEGLDIPIVVFSHYPDNWWDNTDGVPNAIRFPVLAEWIYENYQPDTIVAGYQIWKLKSQSQKQHDVGEKFLYARDWDLKWFPIDLRSNKESSGFTKSRMVDQDSMAIDTFYWPKLNDVLRFKLKGSNKMDLKLEYYRDAAYLGSFSFRFDPDIKYYRIPVSAQVNWNFAKPNRFILRKDSTIKVESFLIEHKEN